MKKKPFLTKESWFHWFLWHGVKSIMKRMAMQRLELSACRHPSFFCAFCSPHLSWNKWRGRPLKTHGRDSLGLSRIPEYLQRNFVKNARWVSMLWCCKEMRGLSWFQTPLGIAVDWGYMIWCLVFSQEIICSMHFKVFFCYRNENWAPRSQYFLIY